ncbi:hypothetical protein GLOIN_2v1176608 [Rhizophagus irregularis DAOM 181602=DAOM 197198]|uniref:TLDc domain-containing protein n=1 Tax=Rhizophagus irregularis (strain DAOM 197198w) TaxID=1432141 RepID=A0A015LE65_RHIIW|nr:hypothetical protein RirG_247060 [Rhizophagus irregularis DAOM 197198w]GET65909.1 hypothetical protein GLOIN_2v1176608 [Rhizophagus irregularis DAOM 181602=DAOM 197198]
MMSKYFRTAFSNEWAEKKDGKFILKNQIFLLIYLTSFLEYLIKHQTEFLHQNPTGILETVYKHETFTDLWDFCLEKICEEPEILFNSDKFVNLKAPLLELFLKRDDLNMDEIEVWESFLNWCFVQQNLDNDPIKWTKDDITKIKRSLHKFISLIRFYDIKPTDFFYNVYNYKDVLPQGLIHDLLEFHIVSDVKPKTNIELSRKPNLNFKLDSTIIQSNHIPLFASWIDRKDSSHYNNKRIPYDFKLLYHSGRDGFDAASFHRNCDNKGPTIFVAKVQDSTQLIGGYNPLDWNGNCGWKTTRDSFLFNFTNEKNTSTAKLGYVKIPENAIYCSNDRGSQMGGFVCYGDNDWENYDDIAEYYPVIGIPNSNFTVENYEVFQVIKK